MSKIAELAYDIQEMYIEGLKPQSISNQLGVPVSVIYDWIETQGLNAEDEYDPYITVNS